jgi:hypothetical protein
MLSMGTEKRVRLRRVWQPTDNPFVETILHVAGAAKWYLVVLGVVLWAYACAFLMLYSPMANPSMAPTGAPPTEDGKADEVHPLLPSCECTIALYAILLEFLLLIRI